MALTSRMTRQQEAKGNRHAGFRPLGLERSLKHTVLGHGDPRADRGGADGPDITGERDLQSEHTSLGSTCGSLALWPVLGRLFP